MSPTLASDTSSGHFRPAASARSALSTFVAVPVLYSPELSPISIIFFHCDQSSTSSLDNIFFHCNQSSASSIVIISIRFDETVTLPPSLRPTLPEWRSLRILLHSPQFMPSSRVLSIAEPFTRASARSVVVEISINLGGVFSTAQLE